MVKKVGDGLIVIGGNELFGACAFCKKEEDLRPFGPNDELICYDCAMKDELTAIKKFLEIINGKPH